MKNLKKLIEKLENNKVRYDFNSKLNSFEISCNQLIPDEVLKEIFNTCPNHMGISAGCFHLWY